MNMFTFNVIPGAIFVLPNKLHVILLLVWSLSHAFDFAILWLVTRVTRIAKPNACERDQLDLVAHIPCAGALLSLTFQLFAVAPSLHSPVQGYGAMSDSLTPPRANGLEDSSRASSIIADADHLDDIDEDKDVYRLKVCVRNNWKFLCFLSLNQITLHTFTVQGIADVWMPMPCW